MVRSNFVYIATYIMAINLMFTLMNTVNDLYVVNMHKSLFGYQIAPFASYNTLGDVNNVTVNMTNPYEVANATQRAANYGPQTGVVDYFGFWTVTKNSVVIILNMFMGGFIGLPLFIYRVAPELIVPINGGSGLLLPFFAILGVIQINGIYEIIRGQPL